VAAVPPAALLTSAVRGGDVEDRPGRKTGERLSAEQKTDAQEGKGFSFRS
jgi:hypothetical protein